MTKIVDNIVGLRDMTTEEQAQYDKDLADWNSKSSTRKLEKIRLYRNRKLEQTDYLATSDNVLTDEMKAFRKSMTSELVNALAKVSVEPETVKELTGACIVPLRDTIM